MPRKKKAVTLVDVARVANCSTKAASLALQHKIGSSELVEIVRQTAERLGYRPISRSTKQIFILAPLDYNPGHYIDIEEQISQFLQNDAFDNRNIVRINMSNIVLNPGLEIAALNHAIKSNPIGIILIAPINIDSIDMLHHSQIPSVVINNRIVEHEIANVCINNRSGIIEAVDHLASMGHKHIAYIHGPKSATSERERGMAYYDAIRSRGLAIRPEYLISLHSNQSPRFQAGYDGCASLLGRSERPTAIIVYNDAMAMGAIRAATDGGIDIPGDLSIIGCDDLPFSLFTTPRLTTVTIDRGDLAEKACGLLMSLLNNEQGHSVENAIVDSYLIIRDTTAPPRI